MTSEVLEAEPRRISDAGDGKKAPDLRVLHVISGLTAGGAETVMFRLINATRNIRHEVICLGKPDWYSDQLQARGIPVHHIEGSSVPEAIAATWKVHRLVKSSNADVVQCWMYRGNVLGGLSSRMAGKPVIWNIRASSLGPLRLASRVLARVGGKLAKWVPEHVINCSVNSAKLHARLGYDAADGTIIPNGYDPALFRPDEAAREKLRRALGIEPGTFVVGAIARWHAQKGLPHLVAALRILRERQVPVRMLLVGIELEPSNLKLMKMIEEAGCANSVQLLGYRADAADIARALDLHVLAAIGAEGFPNAVAESMLAGTPNVVTDVGDAKMIVGDTGWVVEPGKSEQLADAIEQAHDAWSNSAAWARRRKQARKRIEDNFSLSRMVRSYERIWHQVAAKQIARQSTAAISQASGDDQPLGVVHIINDLSAGGAEALLYRLVTSDRKNNHVVVSLGKPAWYSPRLEEQGVAVHHLNVHSPFAIGKGLVGLRKIIGRADVDVVQCWMYRSNVFGGLVAKAAGKPTVWGIHCSSLEGLKPSSRALARFGGRMARWNADFIINCSARSTELHRPLGYSAAPGQVIPNGYDPEVFHPDDARRAKVRKELGIKPGRFLVGSVTRWHAQKDVPNFLRAIRLVNDAGIPIQSILLGHELSIDNHELMEAIRDAGCEEIVTPLWIRTDVPDLARAMDVHVLSSASEAFPNVIAETMLCGTPNVVTDVGDAPLMIGDTGWVVEPRNPRALADSIIKAFGEFSKHPEDWAARRTKARERIVDNFTLERMIGTYAAVWRAVIASSRETVVEAPSNDYRYRGAVPQDPGAGVESL